MDEERSLAKVFFSYSHVDEPLRDQLETQLAMLKRQGVIETWHDRRIGAGEDLHNAIDGHINAADIILLLASPDFLASDYCYEREMARALERHEAGESIVIPVILRPCDWHGAPFGRILATPPDGKPVTQWPDRDHAFLEVTRAIRGAAERLGSLPSVKPAPSGPTPIGEELAIAAPSAIRSSNLRVAKRFTDHDKDAFQHEAFAYMAKFFENSLAELTARNTPHIQGKFRQIDANRFTAVAYREGRAVARCTVFMGGRPYGKGIAYSHSETTESNSYNENLTVEADDQAMFLRSLGMARMTSGRDEKLSPQGAAELYWGLFVEPLQRS